MGRSLFITGTDTHCGKTTASVALLLAGQQRGLTMVGMKPIASGATWNPLHHRYQNGDAELLHHYSTTPPPYEVINPYCFEAAIAPHIAAAMEGITINLEVIHHHHQQLQQQADLVIVEGAGGWLVPINDQSSFADLARYLEAAVVLVVGLRLGCINHALLTAESIQHHGSRLAGWIALTIDPQMAHPEATLTTLRQQLPAPLLGVLPWQDPLHYPTLAAMFYPTPLAELLGIHHD